MSIFYSDQTLIGYQLREGRWWGILRCHAQPTNGPGYVCYIPIDRDWNEAAPSILEPKIDRGLDDPPFDDANPFDPWIRRYGVEG